eukprot:TRINITY_DN12197_c0_g1_i4.p2 TRINITY_DN12197_c0_g1~~TRINITY_DN12197_c0_g1_i4.p2  ORF type:complete len:295 (+),score=36.82 TRINITY_DN12197_c0_g1_i4:66-950(+)
MCIRDRFRTIRFDEQFMNLMRVESSDNDRQAKINSRSFHLDTIIKSESEALLFAKVVRLLKVNPRSLDMVTRSELKNEINLALMDKLVQRLQLDELSLIYYEITSICEYRKFCTLRFELAPEDKNIDYSPFHVGYQYKRLKLAAGDRLSPPPFSDDPAEEIVVCELTLNEKTGLTLRKIGSAFLVSKVQGEVKLKVTGGPGVRIVLYVHEKFIDLQQVLYDDSQVDEQKKGRFFVSIGDQGSDGKNLENIFMTKLRDPVFEVYLQCRNEEERKVKIKQFSMEIEMIVIDDVISD